MRHHCRAGDAGVSGGSVAVSGPLADRVLFLGLQDTWYEFRVLAVMQDLISEPSNIAGISSTGTLGVGVLVQR